MEDSAAGHFLRDGFRPLGRSLATAGAMTPGPAAWPGGVR